MATPSIIQDSFDALEKQRELIANCTLLWKDLTDHFSSIEKDLQIKSQNLRSKRQSLDLQTQQSLLALNAREKSIDSSVDLAIKKVDEIHRSMSNTNKDDDGVSELDLGTKVGHFCKKMDADGFISLISGHRKDVEVFKNELPNRLFNMCVDPGKLVLDSIEKVFSKNDVGWACVLILEALVYALEDREYGNGRLLVTRVTKERARKIADEWKIRFAEGVENVKAADVHAFLQHLVTFGVWIKEEKMFYKKLVLGCSWRRQMPKLALALGLKDQMDDMIEELIRKGQKLDAINFAYEAGLQDKFLPVPLLKSFLKDSNKASALALKDGTNSAQAVNNSNRKKQSALKAVMKCIQDRKLESEFPPEPLQKRLENLEKVRVNKKKQSEVNSPPVNAPVNKRTRANNVGPMPPAKAGRLATNGYVSSFPSPPHSTTTYIHSPSSQITYSPPYAYDMQISHGVYGSISPQTIRDPYAYTSPPINYHHYGYQQAYYR